MRPTPLTVPSLHHRPARCWSALHRPMAVGLVALAACSDPTPPTPTPRAGRHTAMATLATLPPVDAATPLLPATSLRPVRQSQAARDLQTFALNVLLLPLLDDDQPSRWADPSMAFDCDAADVRIDGRRPDVGAPVPPEAFTVRWTLRGCEPLDSYVQVSGDVELRVEPVAGGYRARVRPLGLQVTSSAGVETLSEAFDARLSVGP